MTSIFRSTTMALLTIFGCGCSNDDSVNVSEAIRHGVGAECAVDTDCVTAGATCLTQFKGGYCGLGNCTADADCPAGSVCVTHDDGNNYCFLTCVEKADCNLGRTIDRESNCVANVTYVNTANQGKACVPPSGA